MNQHGYDVKYIEKVQRIYGDLNGDLHLVELERNGASAIGLSLVGNRDTAVMSVFVAGIHPYSLAGADGRIHIGDELLEINGCMLFGRSHLNASAIIKGIASSKLRILLLRNNEYLQRMAVDPLKQMIVDYRDSSSTLIPKKPKSVSLEEFQQQEGNGGIVIEDEDDDDNDDAFQRKTSSPANSETTTLDGSSSINCHPPHPPHLPPPHPPLEDNDNDAVENNDNSCDTSNIGNDETVTTSPLERNMPQKQAQDQPRKPKLQLKIFTEVNDLKDAVLNSSKEINDKEASPDSNQLQPSSRVADVVEDPVTCSVISGKPTTICITKGKQALGVQIIGGSDTLLKSVFVFEIYNEGAAAKDGRLAVGDQILEANNEDFSTATHIQALQILRRPSTALRMVVLREKSAFQEDELSDSVSVELTKKPGKGLGLSIVSKRNGTGVLITDIIKGGAAEMDGRLMVGDEVITVNGEDVHSATQDYAAKLLKTVTGKVSLLVKRMKIGLRPVAQLSSPYASTCSESIIKKSESHAVDCKSAGKQVTKRRTLRYQAVTTCLKSPDD